MAEADAQVSRHEASNPAREAAPKSSAKHWQIWWPTKQGRDLPPGLPWLWKPCCCLSAKPCQHASHPWLPDFTSDGGGRSRQLQGRPCQGFCHSTTGDVTYKTLFVLHFLHVPSFQGPFSSAPPLHPPPAAKRCRPLRSQVIPTGS